jgi:hypothetical protein
MELFHVLPLSAANPEKIKKWEMQKFPEEGL